MSLNGWRTFNQTWLPPPKALVQLTTHNLTESSCNFQHIPVDIEERELQEYVEKICKLEVKWACIPAKRCGVAIAILNDIVYGKTLQFNTLLYLEPFSFIDVINFITLVFGC